MKNRLADPSEIRAHDFEHAFRRSARRSVSASIDNDRSIFDICNTRTGYQPHGDLQQRRCSMEMAYREQWQAEIAALQRILSGFDLREECKWGKPCYTMEGKTFRASTQGGLRCAGWEAGSREHSQGRVALRVATEGRSRLPPPGRRGSRWSRRDRQPGRAPASPSPAIFRTCGRH